MWICLSAKICSSLSSALTDEQCRWWMDDYRLSNYLFCWPSQCVWKKNRGEKMFHSRSQTTETNTGNPKWSGTHTHTRGQGCYTMPVIIRKVVGWKMERAGRMEWIPQMLLIQMLLNWKLSLKYRVRERKRKEWRVTGRKKKKDERRDKWIIYCM